MVRDGDDKGLRIGPQDLSFYAWHEAPVWARAELRRWVWSMNRDRDGENGAGGDGAGAWLDEKIALLDPGGLFQTFMGLYRGEVVWTGSVVQDDRGARRQLIEMGLGVDAFFGLFNTRYDLRGRAIGWIGANYVGRYVTARGNPVIALFTTNPAAERHYKALGFECIGDIYIAAFLGTRRLYLRRGSEPKTPFGNSI